MFSNNPLQNLSNPNEKPETQKITQITSSAHSKLREEKAFFNYFLKFDLNFFSKLLNYYAWAVTT